MTVPERFQDLPLEEVVGDRFGRYSKYIIQDRALPDARDGLKPVQRRILYAMFHEGNTHEKAFRKSAKTVGNVIGNYHPHGDTSVYDAMVRMSQDWKLRHMMVEMHGNNGSVDGDPPAAMRYTEARLSAIAGEMLRDIGKNTVNSSQTLMILNLNLQFSGHISESTCEWLNRYFSWLRNRHSTTLIARSARCSYFTHGQSRNYRR